MSMKTILIVDDDRAVLGLLADGLRTLGYTVATAVSAAEAAALAAAQPFDLAVLDVRLPDDSGLALARRLGARGHPPFVFLSAFGDEAVVQEAAAAGAMGYLVKPVELRQLVPLIEAATARARELAQLRKTTAQLENALASTQKTRTAVGILMRDHGLDRHAAFETLRTQARSQRRNIGELAEQLIAAAESGAPPGAKT